MNLIAKVDQLVSNSHAKTLKESEAEQKLYEEFADRCENEEKRA